MSLQDVGSVLGTQVELLVMRKAFRIVGMDLDPEFSVQSVGAQHAPDGQKRRLRWGRGLT
jgi:hypothetical protein